MKKLLTLLAVALLTLNLQAQPTGGIKGVIVNRSGREALAGASVKLLQDGEVIAEQTTLPDGSFSFSAIEDGSYQADVSANGFLPTTVFVIVEKGLVRDVMTVTLSADSVSSEIDDSAYTEFDMNDSGYSDTPTIIAGSNDPYAAVASFGFSSIRFKHRGFSSEAQEVYLAGVKMNDAITGYTPFSLWSGLNEATRAQDVTHGTQISDVGVGGYNGVNNILVVPSQVRKGWRFSALTNSATYRLRLMGTYASGRLDNGWAYAFNVSARVGGNDWIKGVYYRSFAFYAGAEKKFDDVNNLALVAFVTPGERGAQGASTQEVYDMVGDNMYNSNWGYQAGKVRNARVRKTIEPVFLLKYTFTPSDRFEGNATVLYRTGKNGYTALDWYQSADPRPDYYRNLPSYFKNEDPDYGKEDARKAAWAEEAWRYDYASTRHLDWDRMYNINYASYDHAYDEWHSATERRSRYVQEERRVDQNDVHLALNTIWRQSSVFTLNAGVNGRYNRTENYKVIADLLGGDYYVNIDNFAERSFTAPELLQNDYDYYMEHGHPQLLHKGDKYGYDYLANVIDAEAWANAILSFGGLSVKASAAAGYNSLWRTGLVRKGLFLDNSKGDSEKPGFFTYRGKLGIDYSFVGGHTLYANVAYVNDAPKFNQAFVSPRTRNSLVPHLTTVKTTAADINYLYAANGYNIRVTGYWAQIKDQTKVMSFYDDSQQSFTNFAMSGIDERHVGVEIGWQIPLVVSGLSLKGALAWGEHIYTSTPKMTQTIDNSAEVIYSDEPVKYWAQSPVYRWLDKENNLVDQDANGPIIDHWQKHHIASTPQLAADLSLNYRTKSYWFFTVEGQYFANSYLDMNPLYRMEKACMGPDKIETPVEVEYMASQEKFDPVFLLNASIGKSWYLQYKYNFGFSLSVNNILNNRNVKTGGYEQSRLTTSSSSERYYKFDSKYFYMQGVNYMLNLYFRF